MKLQFTPGLNRETTGYANEGGWWDADKVRFRAGYPEKIGGWQKFSPAALLGTCRAIHPWVGLDNNEYIGFGTSQKYYVYGNGIFNDITPIRDTTPAGAVTVAAAYSSLFVDITATANEFRINSASLFPAGGGKIKIDSEEMSYTSATISAIDGDYLRGVTRGLNGTTPAVHLTSAPVNCATLTITDANNGVVQNDFVTFSGAATLGGNITAAVLNQEYQVTSVISPSVFTVEARTVSTVASVTTSTGLSPAYVYATSSDTGNSGGATLGAYQINTGLDSAVSGNGWGAGPWGIGGWGEPATTTTSSAQLRLWGHDNFGENLLFNVRDGGIYYWERDLAFPRAVALSSLPGAATTPTIAKQVIVSDNDRHVIVFGCDDEGAPGVQDPLLIRFSASESLTQWQTLSTSTAGSIRIGSGSTIVTAIETKQEIVVFTNTAVHSLKYIGAPYTFGITMLSDNTSIVSPNAAMSVGDAVYWMGEGEFYSYNGTVTQMPCKVKDYVFSSFNRAQSEKVAAGANPAFGEVWWFYPSADSDVNDRYVVYNYQQELWYFGTLARTAWTHKNIGPYPIAAGGDKYIYSHEYGTDDGSQNPPVGIEAYIESSGQDIGDGEQFTFIWRMIPDLTFRTSTGTPSVLFTVKTSRFPGTDYSQVVDSSVVRSTSYPVEQFTDQLYTRLRGRSFAFRISSSLVGTAWRLGAPRLDIKTDGKR